jgi:hypothetical protein
MLLGELPRISELRDLADNTASPDAYFREFDDLVRNDPQVRQFWQAREDDLTALQADAWDFLKNKIRPSLTARDKRRGWSQFFDTLNEARGYRYLKGIGCSGVRFIPCESGKKSEAPDLEADLDGARVLCEVKTVNVSDEEAVARVSYNKLITGKVDLEKGFFTKLAKLIQKAKRQMHAYDASSSTRKIVYLVVNFDDLLGDCKIRFFAQLDRHLTENPVPGVELVLHNQKTPLYKAIKMTAATVVNE